MTTLEDLMAMKTPDHHAALVAGHPLDPDVLAGRMYLGVDLSLPGWVRKLLWHTFRKTFHRDEETGQVRGWNVKMEQRGIGQDQVPLTDRKGRQKTFGHYVVSSAEGIAFPTGYRGPNYLNYGDAGNSFFDLARLGRTPLVAVNEGSQDLLLGWEVMKAGPLWLPLPFYWALKCHGPLDEVVAPPRS